MSRASKKLDGGLEVQVSGLDVGEASQDAAARFDKTFDSPIDFAVALLENSEGVIALEFPISGTVDKPALDFSGVVNHALRGELVGFSSKGGDFFPPVVFQPGSATLDAEARENLVQIAKLLNQKPKLSIRLCGKATAEDVEALFSGARDADASEKGPPPEGNQDRGEAGQANSGVKADRVPAPTKAQEDRLTGLARERTQAVRNYLAADMKIAAGRLSECRVAFSMHDSEGPRVHVSP